MRGRLSKGISLLLLGLGISSGVGAADGGRQLHGTLYALGSRRTVKLYAWEMTVCPEVWTSRYRRLDGTLVVEDFTRFAGRRLSEHRYVRHTTGERSSVQVHGSNLEFEYRRGAQRKVATLAAEGVFLTGPAVFPFIEQQLSRLLSGDELEFKYGVLDRLDYFTFELSSQSKLTDRDLVVRIRAASPFVRMAIDPIEVTLSRTGQFKGIRGRTIIMEMRGERMMPIDAELVVEAERPTTCAPATPSPDAAGKARSARARRTRTI
jgi:hypothetical protein